MSNPLHHTGPVKNDWLRPAETVLAYVSGVCILAMMFIVGTDVAMRYIFNAPLPWAFDVVSMYLLVGGFFLALPISHTEASHVRVDILVHHYPKLFRRICEMVACGCGAMFLGAMAIVNYNRAIVAFMGNEVVVGLFPWPTWLSIVLVPIGAGLLALRLVVSAVAHGLSLFMKTELIELPISSEQQVAFGKTTE